MSKKGVSPLIASIFLVGVAMMVGVLVFASTFSLNSNLIDDQNKKIDSFVLLSFDSKYPRNFNCSSLCAGTDVKCNSSNCYCILIENEESQKVNFLVKTKGNFGSELCSPDNFELDRYQSKIFAVGFNGSKIGTTNITSEIEALLILDN
jgi:hypothetical protein